MFFEILTGRIGQFPFVKHQTLRFFRYIHFLFLTLTSCNCRSVLGLAGRIHLMAFNAQFVFDLILCFASVYFKESSVMKKAL
jgi:hypothetical protein